MKCCVCEKEIVEKPHEAPTGVFLCSKACFQEWKLSIVCVYAVLQLRNNLYGRPEVEREKEVRLESTYNWIVGYDQKTAVDKYVS